MLLIFMFLLETVRGNDAFMGNAQCSKHGSFQKVSFLLTLNSPYCSCITFLFFVYDQLSVVRFQGTVWLKSQN